MHRPPACADMIRISPQPNKKPSRKAGLFVWRRWRDSNSRGAFDPYTISNRARSTNYATSPYCSRKQCYSLVSLRIIIYLSDKVKNIFEAFRKNLKKDNTRFPIVPALCGEEILRSQGKERRRHPSVKMRGMTEYPAAAGKRRRRKTGTGTEDPGKGETA